MSEWVKCSKELPEVEIAQKARVLVTDGRVVVPARFFIHSYNADTDDVEYRWESAEDGIVISERSITYWRYYPDPPRLPCRN